MDKIMIDAGEIGTPPAGSPAPAPAPESTPSGQSLRSQEDALRAINVNEVDEALGVETDDAEEEASVAEADTAPAEAEASPDVAELPVPVQDYLKESGIEGFESLKDFVDDQKAQVRELLDTFKLAGMDPTRVPDNLRELTAVLQQELANKAMAQQVPQPEPEAEPEAAPLDLKGFFAKHKDQLDESYLPIYQDLAATVANHVLAQLPKQNQVDPDTEPGNLALEMLLYNEAKSAAGDGPVPSFGEARQLVRASKEALPTFRFFAGRIGNTKNNPYATAFQTWGASKAPGGVTKAQEAKAQASAKKVLIAKSMLTPTPATRPKTKSFEQLSAKEQADALRNMKA
jgi:hypothetical protein